MIDLRNTIILAAATIVFMPTIVAAEEPQAALQRNPFERPAVELLAANVAVVNNNSLANQDPGLRAVLVAGSKSVVNFGGDILQIGESSGEYRLLSVDDGKATFSRNDKTIVFSIYDQKSGENR